MKKIKTLLALILALAMVFSLAACGSDSKNDSTDTGSNNSDAQTQDTAGADSGTQDTDTDTGADTNTDAGRTFTVGFDAEFPPYGYRDENGEYVGFDLDLAQAVCDYYGWTLVKQPINWDSKDMELDSGSIDCIWNGFTITGREDDYTWTDAYIDNSQVFVVRADSGITSFDQLAGKVVDVQADSSALAALTNEEDNDENLALAASFASLQQVSDYNTAFLDLESGAVDAVAMDIGVANYQLSGKEDEFVILDERLSSEEYGIGFKKGNTELRDQVQEALFAMLDDGTFADIAKKWQEKQF